MGLIIMLTLLSDEQKNYTRLSKEDKIYLKKQYKDIISNKYRILILYVIFTGNNTRFTRIFREYCKINKSNHKTFIYNLKYLVKDNIIIRKPMIDKSNHSLYNGYIINLKLDRDVELILQYGERYFESEL